MPLSSIIRTGCTLLVVLLSTPAAASIFPGGGPFVFVPPKDGGDVRDRAESPITLTASDGTGLEMVALEAHGMVEAPLGFTELRMTFRNPENRVLEGRFRITLPSGASISRFAMKIGDHWQEGEVVERQAARVAYEDFLHRRQDPALLEHEGGNEFSARVFPIPARAEKELILSYSHELADPSEPFRIPLVGLPKLQRLDVRMLVGRVKKGTASTSLGGTTSAYETVEIHKRDWMPDRDFEVAQADAARAGLRSGNLAVARVTPAFAARPERISSLYILVDSSASRALGFEEQVRTVGRLVEAFARGSGRKAPVGVALFDQDVELVHEGPAGAFNEREIRQMLERRALGASNPHRALEWLDERLASRAWKGGKPRVLLVTDGVATAGPAAGDRLREVAAGLKKRGVERLDVLAVGGIRDDEALKRLVTAGLPKDGAVIDGRLPLVEIGRRLTLATRSDLTVAVDGARWVWPERLDGVQPGDSFLVYADLPEDRPMRVSLGGVSMPVAALETTERPLLERAWVRARIARLMHQRDTMAANDPDLQSALAKQATELSIRHRVLTPFTALLVLETEHDYRRFNIDRNALTDILSLGPTGLTVVNRSAQTVVVAPPPRRQEKSSGSLDQRGQRSERERTPGNDLLDALSGFASESAPGEALGGLASRSASGNTEVRGLGAGGGGVRGGGAPVPPAAAQPPPRSSASRDAWADEARMAEEQPRQERSMRMQTEGESAPRRSIPVRPVPPAPRKPAPTHPWEGRFQTVMTRLQKGQRDAALKEALAWRDGDPGDVLALVALGEAFEAKRQLSQAARAYGSLIDLFPSRADMRRFAGQRLERIENAQALELAMDTYARAVEQRPDHPSSHRLHAFALLRNGRHAEAFEAILAGLKQRYPPGRFAGVDRILREDLGLVAAAWVRAEPKRRRTIEQAVRQAGATLPTEPSVRFVLYWETDANDVDFHIHDGKGAHAFYRQPQLSSGGSLYADVTTGYGPECFTIDRVSPERTYPYRLEAHYYSRGPMGYGMGKLQVIEHDGKGGLAFEERPFVIMKDGATVDLGLVKGPLRI